MGELLRLEIVGTPATKGSWRCLCHGGKPRLIPDNEAEQPWALAIAWAARAKLRGKEPTTARVAVRCEFTMPPRAGRKSYNRDVDKLLRSVLDALTGILWIDDEQVDRVVADKFRGDTPGATIIVETIVGERMKYGAEHANAKIALRLTSGRHLSPMQLRVVRYIAIGLERREIALATGLAVRTIDAHRIEALRRLELRNNVDLAKWAIMAGYIAL